MKRGVLFYWLRLTMSLSKRTMFRYLYYFNRGVLPNFEEPSNISEFILGESLKGNLYSKAQYADKFLVRDYLISIGLGDVLTELYDNTDKFSNLRFENYPKKFVLKMNNGCGRNYVCLDKDKLNISELGLKFKEWNKRTNMRYEDHYDMISPLILCEEFIEDKFNYEIPIDYKFMCFKGKVKCILVCVDRSSEGGASNSYCYDINFNIIPDYLSKKKENPNLRKPEQWDDMVKIASRLSKDFKFVRVDLYYSKRGIVFSELTFTPGMGILSTFSMKALEDIYHE